MATEKCCCFDLRTGSFIIFWLYLIISIIGFCLGFLNCFISFIIAILGIYAILKNKPAFLWPHLVYETLKIVVISILAIILFVVLPEFELPTDIDIDLKRVIQFVQNNRVPFIIVILGELALTCYLLKVVVLYYQEMKKEIPAYTETITVDNMECGYPPQNGLQVAQLTDHMSCSFKH